MEKDAHAAEAGVILARVLGQEYNPKHDVLEYAEAVAVHVEGLRKVIERHPEIAEKICRTHMQDSIKEVRKLTRDGSDYISSHDNARVNGWNDAVNEVLRILEK